MLRIRAIDIDAWDAAALAQFWASALGWSVTATDEDGEITLAPPEGSAEAGIVPDSCSARARGKSR